jgi:hypothetical protein
MRLESCALLVPRPQILLLGLWQAQRWHLPWPGTDTQTPHKWNQATLRGALPWWADGMAGQRWPPSWDMGTIFSLVYTCREKMIGSSDILHQSVHSMGA